MNVLDVNHRIQSIFIIPIEYNYLLLSYFKLIASNRVQLESFHASVELSEFFSILHIQHCEFVIVFQSISCYSNKTIERETFSRPLVPF